MQNRQNGYFTPVRVAVWILAVLLLTLSFLGVDRRDMPIYADAIFVSARVVRSEK